MVGIRHLMGWLRGSAGARSMRAGKSILAWLARVGVAGALLSAALGASVLAARSQEADQAKPAPWTSNCTSPGRGLPLECAVRQRAFIGKPPRFMGMITIRVPSDTKKPVIMSQTPLGLFLPAGLDIDIDGDMAQNYPFQSCSANGCYAGIPITGKLLDRMFKGGRLNVTFQHMNKKRLTLPMSLIGFSEAYGRIR